MFRVLLNGGRIMSIHNENLWRRPLSKRGKRNFIVVMIIAFIFLEAWMGWTRLFVAHDRQYQVVFILFIAGVVSLLSTLLAASIRASSATNWRTFNILRTVIAALSLLFWVGSGLFYG